MTSFLDTGQDSTDPNAIESSGGSGVRGWLSTLAQLERQQGRTLVRVPFLESGWRTLNNHGSASWIQDDFGNPDGSNSGLDIACGSNASPDAAWVTIDVYFLGRTIGLYYRDVSGMTNFSAGVNDVMRKVSANPPRGVLDGNDSQGAQQLIVAHDLPSDGPHCLHLHFPGAGDGATGRSWVIYGLLLESSVGYATTPTVSVPGIVTALTTAGATTGKTLANGSNPAVSMRYFDAIWFANTTGAPIVVTVTLNTTFTYPISVPANGNATFSLGTRFAYSGLSITTASNGVNAMPLGGS